MNSKGSHMEQSETHPISKFRLIGGLFLLAFVFYGGGSVFVENAQPIFGLVFMLANSVTVIFIGALLRPIIFKYSPFYANVYLGTRFAEALLLGIGATVLVLGPLGFNGGELNTTLYRLAMIILGLGSIGFCRWLIVTRAVYVALAWLGLVGYLLLAMAMMAEFLGSENWATILLIPGALFELIFGLLLFFVGVPRSWHARQR